MLRHVVALPRQLSERKCTDNSSHSMMDLLGIGNRDKFHCRSHDPLVRIEGPSAPQSSVQASGKMVELAATDLR